LADPQALNQAVAAYQACHFIGMPECDVSTLHTMFANLLHLAERPHSGFLQGLSLLGNVADPFRQKLDS